MTHHSQPVSAASPPGVWCFPGNLARSRGPFEALMKPEKAMRAMLRVEAPVNVRPVGLSGQTCSLAHYLEGDHATNDDILHRPLNP